MGDKGEVDKILSMLRTLLKEIERLQEENNILREQVKNLEKDIKFIEETE